MSMTLSNEVNPAVSSSVMPSFFANENLRLLVFCGKGGTGKTTSAAATALRLAKLHNDTKILVVSVDPAHSLGDSFDYAIGAKKTPIRDTDNLWAMEMEPEDLLEAFRKRHSREIEKTISRANILHQADVKEFLSLSLPGMDQVMTFIEIAGMLKSTWFAPSEYDLIIMDTAPTGQLLELLSVLDNTDKWVRVFKAALNRSIWFRGQHKGDFVHEFVNYIRESLGVVRELVRNAEQTEFVPVTIPEAMSIYETGDLVAALEGRQIPVENVIVNRAKGDGHCPFCSPVGETGKGAIEEIDDKFGHFNLIHVPLFPYEIKGADRLAEYAGILSGETCHDMANSPADASSGISATSATEEADLLESGLPPLLPGGENEAMSSLMRDGLEFILFSGKGGVGKTSVAAATALYAAQHYPDKKILVYSIDPAHSLADSFDCSIGDRVVPIPGVENLYAAEVDLPRLRDEFMSEYRSLITGAFDTWEKKRGPRLDIRFDRNILVSLTETIPPGLDEVLALEKVLESVEKREYSLYILDMAPTGHALEVLEFPQVIRDWLSKAYRGLTKHDRDMPLDNLRELGEKIMKSTVATRRVKQALTDSSKTEFVAVTIPEAMSIAELKRLLSAVTRLGIPCHHLVINMIIPPTRCDSCRLKREEQLRYVQELLDSKSPEHLVSGVPLFTQQIRGVHQLKELAGILYGQQIRDFEAVVGAIEKKTQRGVTHATSVKRY